MPSDRNARSLAYNATPISVPHLPRGEAEAERVRNRCRRWNFLVLGLTLALAAMVIALNYHLNVYGVFGDSRGRKLVVYDNERTTKYLFSYNYIPANFDALLVGTSISDNWDTGQLTSMRAYNASLNGGDISEEALLVGNILQRAHPRIMMFVIHPYLTEASGRKSGYMNPQEYWGALGSIQLLRVYWTKWQVERGLYKREFNEFGQDDYDIRPALPGMGVPPGTESLLAGQSALPVNAAALKEYGELLQKVRSSGTKIVGIIPPVESGLWRARGHAYQDYYDKIKLLFQSGELIVDFNAGEFDELRDHPANFPDGIHLSRYAALQIVEVLNQKLGNGQYHHAALNDYVSGK